MTEGNQADNKHPYSNLEDRFLWKKAVGERSPFSLEGLYRKKFQVSPEARIATAGSCFAQHIARHLKNSGFNFRDFEPAPPLFPPALSQSFNYGVYSARYCNIYTARQLLQTFDRAFGEFLPVDNAWTKGSGFADPFRPVLEPEPFASVEELERSRQSHFAAVQDLIVNTDVLIFTLGLTEAWVSKADGAVFPLCPGTVAGAFDENAYEFKNFTYFEIFEDLIAFLGKVRQINPDMHFILTVSPVPLTATKSGEHVLAATTYSKSVLRAVAGHIASEVEFVDYFPSYEIIAAAPMRGMFYDPNMRTVNAAGVDYVMSHFFAEHAPPAGKASPASLAARPDAGAMEAVCEEMLLAQGI
ncbi:GSCFA domain-containing protein [Rhizobium sp. S96]|uniref:GSCFA domain-containing protein n=1 Tax=Rhizobium sp. S96 TaxID=3055140 RepID=UPI0025AAC4A0|nr:GSCFA domain-containing protein [Rhizobium sp. S96]MDM9620702.1 GSCFA domain-containing protein [Rhizobium sp. S96]